jgi:hypothetical protein
LQGLSNTVKNDENNNESVGEEYEDKSWSRTIKYC